LNMKVNVARSINESTMGTLSKLASKRFAPVSSF
jgi:hypothetical protein